MACAGVCSSAAWTLQWRAACLVDEGKTLATRLVSARLPRPLAPPQSSPMERALAAMVMRQSKYATHRARQKLDQNSCGASDQMGAMGAVP